jgi:membrane-associated phospholipid phosphatase
MGISNTRVTARLPIRAPKEPPSAPAAGADYIGAQMPRAALWAPLVLVLLAAAALAVDCPLARWCVDGYCPLLVARLLRVVEPFGSGFGVLVIAVVMYQLDPVRRWALARVLAMAWGAGLAADAVKMLIVRIRPHHFNFEGTVADTFGRWLPLMSVGSGRQSFPSAHTATAVALAIALAWLYPRGRWLFASLAVLVAAERMQTGAHYLSDTLCGAALGCVVATACLRSRLLVTWFGRLERRLRFLWRRPNECIISSLPGDRASGEATEEKRPHAA